MSEPNPPIKYNFSHTLFTKTNCMKRLEFHIKKLHPETEDEKPDFLLRGIFFHEQIEHYLRGEPLLPFGNSYDEVYFTHVILPAVDARKGDIFKVEQELVHPLGVGDVDAKGFLDLSTESPDGDILYDWKFVKSPWNEWKLKKYEDEQAYLYLWLYREVTKRTPSHLEYVVFNFPDQPQVFKVPYDYTRVEIEVQKWRSQCEQINSAIEFDAFLASPSKWNCRFCEFKKVCPYSS